MTTIPLTKASIEALPAPDPSGKQRIWWDEALGGFGVLCSGTTDAKSYIAQGVVNKKTRRITIAKVSLYEAAGKTVRDARRAAALALVNLRAGIDPKDKGDVAATVTLRECLEEYLKAGGDPAFEKPLTKSSQATYRGTIYRHFSPWLDKPLRDISAQMIETKYHQIRSKVAEARQNEAERRQRRAERRGESPPERDTFVSPPGTGSANAALRTFRLLWHFAVDGARPGDISPWPSRRFNKKHRFGEYARRQRVKAADLEAFYQATNALDERGDYLIGPAFRDLILLLLFTGFRKTEATALRWANVNFSTKIIHLPHTKSGRPFHLPMSDFVYELLLDRRALGTKGPFVFPSISRTGYIQEPQRGFDLIAKRCGIAISSHALRRTFLTVGAQCPRVTPFELKALVNHSLGKAATGEDAFGEDVTERYIQLDAEELRQPAQELTDRLKRLCGIAGK